MGTEAAALVEALRGCRVFHFHDTSRDAPVKQQGYTADNRALHSDAGNLGAVMLRLQDGDRGRYQRVVRMIKQVAPFFRDFVLEPELAPDRVRLRWRQEGRTRSSRPTHFLTAHYGSSASPRCQASQSCLASSSWTSRNSGCIRSRSCS